MSLFVEKILKNLLPSGCTLDLSHQNVESFPSCSVAIGDGKSEGVGGGGTKLSVH